MYANVESEARFKRFWDSLTTIVANVRKQELSSQNLMRIK